MKFKRCIPFMNHKIVYVQGFGYVCKHCGKTKSECNK